MITRSMAKLAILLTLVSSHVMGQEVTPLVSNHKLEAKLDKLNKKLDRIEALLQAMAQSMAVGTSELAKGDDNHK